VTNYLSLFRIYLITVTGTGGFRGTLDEILGR